MSAPRRSTRAASLVSLLVVVALVLTGCSTWFLPPTSKSTPTGETVAADLARYYHQVLTWKSCADNLQCTTAIVPLDWSHPSGATISLALIRHVASGGTARGSLLVNPGGPGASGVDFIRDSLDYAVDAKLQASYDIVGFDPRGVQHSTEVKCTSSPKQLDAYLFDLLPGVRGSAQWIAALKAQSAQFGASCLKYTGPLLGHVDTVSAARDLDVLRAALGDHTLNYLGYSYGSLLGQTYAGLFPAKTGRMVIDGVVNPDASSEELTLAQAKGFEAEFRAFLGKCPTYNGCPFTGTVADSLAKVQALIADLDASPLRNSDGRELGGDTMITAILYPLYNEANWPALVQLFTSVNRGSAAYAFTLADGYFERNSDGTYIDNSAQANVAVNCLDYPSDAKPADLRAQAAQLLAVAPTVGPLFAWGGDGCADWPFPPTGKIAPIVADGSPPILVLGTTGDPATPYQFAVAVAHQLHNGHLVTYHGEGHTAYNKGHACVDSAVDRFLVSGTVPSTDPNC